MKIKLEKEKERKTEYSFMAQEQRSLLTWVIYSSGSLTSVLWLDISDRINKP